MNKEMADKFLTVLAECAVTGDGANLRKEAAANQLLKQAFDAQPYMLGAAGGALLGGTAGYFSEKEDKKRLRNLLYGAGLGGLGGAGAVGLGQAYEKGRAAAAGVSRGDSAVTNNPDVKSAPGVGADGMPQNPATKPESARALANAITNGTISSDQVSHAATDTAGATGGAALGWRAVRDTQRRYQNEPVELARRLDGSKNPAAKRIAAELQGAIERVIAKGKAVPGDAPAAQGANRHITALIQGKKFPTDPDELLKSVNSVVGQMQRQPSAYPQKQKKINLNKNPFNAEKIVREMRLRPGGMGKGTLRGAGGLLGGAAGTYLAETLGRPYRNAISQENATTRAFSEAPGKTTYNTAAAALQAALNKLPR